MTIREASNDLKSTIERIDRLQLKAPTDGMVVYQQVRGERVKEGYQARPGWPLMSIPDLSRMQVKIFLNEVDQTKIRSGLDATLVLDAYPEQEFHGKVREIARLAQTVTGEELLKGFICYVDIDGTDPRLKPGISAKVNIILDRMEDVVSVPVGAVYEIDGQYVVYEQGRQKPTEIEVGPRNDGFIVVNNLEPGTRMSWIPYTNAQMLGWHEEQKRIAEVYQKIQQSFVIFADRGILFDYGVDQAGASEQETSQSPGVDLDKLPAAIRDRLQSQNTGETGTEPNIVVESPEGRTRDGTFRVSPNMLERLNRSTDTRRDTSSAQR